MSRSSRSVLILWLALSCASVSLAQQPQPAAAGQASPSWVVSVVHTVDTQIVIELLRRQQARVGVSATTPPQMYNIATGLVVDGQGHVVTRLANIDPENKDQKVTVITADGRSLTARFIGMDCATGFAVLEVESLKATPPGVVAVSTLANGAAVNILSAAVSQRIVSGSGNEKVYFYPSITQAQGRVKTDSIYSKTHGALTLLSEGLLARSDSSIVTTAQNQVVGIAKFMGHGRAYLYPVEFIRDTVAKRVIEKNGSVAAGWLGVVGNSLAEIPAAEFAALGLERKAGVIIREVAPDSPAAKGGLLPNDVIVGLDDFDVVGEADLKALLMSSPAGRNVRLRAVRNQEPMEVNVSLGAKAYSPMDISLTMLEERAPSLSQMDQINARLIELGQRLNSRRSQPPSPERDEAIREIGLEARQLNERRLALSRVNANVSSYSASFPAGFFALDMTPQLAKEKFNLAGGILVAGVRPGSAADRAGLKAGDVIVGTTEKEPMSAEQLRTFLQGHKGAVALKVVRRSAGAQANEAIVINLNN